MCGEIWREEMKEKTEYDKDREKCSVFLPKLKESQPVPLKCHWCL